MPNTFTLLRRLLPAAVVALGVLAGTATPTATAADNEDDGPRQNACTPEQRAGGYEDLGGRCQLTGWNWSVGDGQCLNDLQAEHGSGHQGGCQPTGCVTPVCNDHSLPPGAGGGSGGGTGGGSGFDPDLPNFGIDNLQDFRPVCDSIGADSYMRFVPPYVVASCSSDTRAIQCKFREDGTVASCDYFEIMPAPEEDPAGGVEHSGDGEVAEPVSTGIPTATAPGDGEVAEPVGSGTPTTFPTAQLELADTTTIVAPVPTVPPLEPTLSTTPPCWSNPRISCAISFEAA